MNITDAEVAEFGRRAGFRTQWPKGLAGSIPVLGIFYSSGFLFSLRLTTRRVATLMGYARPDIRQEICKWN